MTKLPTGWTLEALGDVSEIQGGKTPSKLEQRLAANPRSDRDVPFYKVGDMSFHPRRLIESRVHIAVDEARDWGIQLVAPGAVVFPKAGGAIATNKKRVMDRTGGIDLNCMAVKAGPRLLDEYVFWWFQGLDLASLSDGSVLPQLSKTTISSLLIPVPPLDEQQRIVAILEDHLSRLDAASGSLAAMARLSPIFARSGTHAALTSVPVEWRPLSTVLEGIEAGKSFTCLPRTSEDGEWGVIKVSAMTWGEFRPEENKAVPPGKGVDERFQIMQGDVLVSRANTEQYVGAPVIVRERPDRLLLSDKSLRLLPAAGVDREWLIAALQGPSTRRQISALATGTKDSMRNISQGALSSVEVPVPIHEIDQQSVSKAVERVNEARKHLDSARTDLNRRRDALRRSLLQAAFSGQLTKESSGV